MRHNILDFFQHVLRYQIETRLVHGTTFTCTESLKPYWLPSCLGNFSFLVAMTLERVILFIRSAGFTVFTGEVWKLFSRRVWDINQNRVTITYFTFFIKAQVTKALSNPCYLDEMRPVHSRGAAMTIWTYITVEAIYKSLILLSHWV